MPEEEMHERAPDSSNPKPVDYVEEKLRELLESDQTDFGAWTSLIAQVEKSSPSDPQKICLVYDSFLSEFPLCYGYWKKYAGHMARLCTFQEVEEVYERAVKAAAYCVDLWVCYCSFGELSYEPDDVRRLYARGFSFVGKDYLCYLLWDKYIKFEFSQKQWSQLVHIYINTLRFPTKRLHSYYERFKNMVAVLIEDMGSQDNMGIDSAGNIDTVSSSEITDINTCGYAEISNVIRDIFDQQDGHCKPDIVKKYTIIGELLYKKSSQLDKKISSFETRIRRSYFHVKPLDDCQIENWHKYLDFVEMQGDFDGAVKLYERCLIPCANYSEFWIRYVEFVEPKCGREIAKYAITRALTVFMKKVPAFHIYSAIYMEHIGDVGGARSSCLACGTDSVPIFIENINRQANMEKRMGNIGSAFRIYTSAIEMVEEKHNNEILSALYINFARFTFVVSGNIDDATKVFIMGIQQTPCKLIIEGLILFVTMHGGKGHIATLDSIVANAISPGSDISRALNPHDREGISKLFLEFVDLHGTISEIRMAWDRHRRLFPHIMKPLPLTASISSATFKNTPLDKSLAVKNGMLSHDSADILVNDVSPLTNNAPTTEKTPMDNCMQERNGSLADSSLDDCRDSNHIGTNVHVMDNPSFINNAAILCEENENVLRGTKDLEESSMQERNGSLVDSSHDGCEDNSHILMEVYAMDKPSLMYNAAIPFEENKNVLRGTIELEELAEAVEKQSKPEEILPYMEVDRLIDESHFVVQTLQAPSECAETKIPIHGLPDLDPDADLMPCAFGNLSINSPNNECREVYKLVHEIQVQTSEVSSECTETENTVHKLPDLEPDAGLTPPSLANLLANSPHDECQEFNQIKSPQCVAQQVISSSDADKNKHSCDGESNEILSNHPSSPVLARLVCQEILSKNTPDNECEEFSQIKSPQCVVQEDISSTDADKNKHAGGSEFSEVLSNRPSSPVFVRPGNRPSSPVFVRPGSQENLSKNTQDNECEEFSQIKSPQCVVQEVIASTDEDKNKHAGDSEFSDVLNNHPLSPVQVKFDSQENLRKDSIPLRTDGNITPRETPTNMLQMQVQEDTTVQRDLPVESQVHARFGSQENLLKDNILLCPDGKRTPETPTNKLQMQLQEETNVQRALPVESRLRVRLGSQENFQKDSIPLRPDLGSQENFQKDNIPLRPDRNITPETSTSKLQMQVQEETNVQLALPVDSRHPQNTSTAGNYSRKHYSGQAFDVSSVAYHDYVQPSEAQQTSNVSSVAYQAPMDLQSATNSQIVFSQGHATNSQMLISQGHIYQPQGWTSTQDQQANQIQGKYSMHATAQGYPAGNLALSVQNIQQAVIYAQPQPNAQPTTQPQSQVYQNTLQSNGQYGYFQNGQGVQPHFWQYYQQLYYMQQQQNQQGQSHPQQQWPIEQLQQLQQKLAQQQQSQNQQFANQMQQTQGSQQQLNIQELQQQQLLLLQQGQNQHFVNQLQQTQENQQQLNSQEQQQQQLLLLQQGQNQHFVNQLQQTQGNQQQLNSQEQQQQQGQSQHFVNQLQQTQGNQQQLNSQEQQQQQLVLLQQGQNQQHLQQHQIQFQQWNQTVGITQQQNQPMDNTQQQYILYLQQQQQMYVQQQQQLYIQQQQQVLLQQQLLQQQQQQQQLLQQQQYLQLQPQTTALEPTASNSNVYLQGEGDKLQITGQSRSSQSPAPQ